MESCEGAHDGKSESASGEPTGVAAAALVEPLEDRLELTGGNAGTFIAHPEAGVLAFDVQ